MSVTEDSELRDLVKQTLEKSGVLPKIRAELRANVFLVLDQNGCFQENKYRNEKLKTFMDTEDGLTAVKVVREFLEYFDLSFTASVFEEEILRGKYYNYCGRPEFSQLFQHGHFHEGPVISQLLRVVKDNRITTGKRTEDDIPDNRWKLDASLNNHVTRNDSSPSDFFTKQSHKNDLDDFFALNGDHKTSFNLSARFDSSLNFEKPENKSIDADNKSFNSPQKWDVLKPIVTKQNSGSNKQNTLSSLDDLPPLTVPTTQNDVTFTLSAKHKHISEKLKSVLIDTPPENHFSDISQASSLSDDEKKKYHNRNITRLFNATADSSHSQDEESISEIDEILSASNEDTASGNNSNNSGGDGVVKNIA